MDGGVLVEGLVKVYGEIEAVRDVSFDVEPGEVMGLLGPNGAGKTTTMRVLASVIRPTAGRAIVNGADVVRERDRVRRSVGYLPERSGLPARMTGERYLTMFARLHGLADPEGRAREVARELGISDRLGSKLGSLSKGLKRRVAIARALVHDPPVLLLDEPTSGLDPISRAQVLDLIARQAAEGKAVLVSSHVLSEMERICTRVCLISRGRVLARGPLDEVRSSAGRPVLRLRARMAGDLVPLLEAALREARLAVRLRDLNGVVEVDPIGGPGDLRSAAAVVLRRLLDEGVVPDLFEIHRPTLEEAFVALVGGAARAGDLGAAG
ncbi:MAG: ABC transporter ATP-binding protein [Candidatus Korarchaeota archaeon]|nr:ABC transporter ATP-binding protein [Candidatus Korarchaeota archaeon]